jgi:hypothetical protein
LYLYNERRQEYGEIPSMGIDKLPIEIPVSAAYSEAALVADQFCQIGPR